MYDMNRLNNIKLYVNHKYASYLCKVNNAREVTRILPSLPFQDTRTMKLSSATVKNLLGGECNGFEFQFHGLCMGVPQYKLLTMC